MLIDWTPEFDAWLDRLEGAAGDDDIAQRSLDYMTAQLQVLQQRRIEGRRGYRPVEKRGRPMTPPDKGSARLRKLLADPARAERVAAVREGMREMDRAYRINLALIRSAAQLTQTELAERLGVGQAAVSKLERKPDLLLSTLVSYLHAANAQARIVVSVGGQDIEYPLANVAAAERTSEQTS